MSISNRNSSIVENKCSVKTQIQETSDEISPLSDQLLHSMDIGNLCQYDQTNQNYRIGSYVLDKVIGRGNFSVVKLAIHVPTQMQVAVKILHKSKMTGNTLEKTYREVKIMKKLRHCNIVQLYQVIESSNWMFIIMEYLSHGELFEHLTQVGRLAEKDARVKFKQTLDAIEYCHKMNIVHRDLKSENLLMDGNFNIKLADFGFGSFYNDSSLLSTWCGSPPYAAPELFKGEPYIGPKADIWSLGVVLYAMVCGKLPFDEPYSIVKLRQQVLFGLVRFPYFLSYECELLIRMILNRNPAKRPSIDHIRSHKWMEPTLDKMPVLSDISTNPNTKVSTRFVQRRLSRRCYTQSDDSGFDEPRDFVRSISENNSLSMDHVCSDYEVNDDVIQIMERSGFKRSSIIEELNRNTYGPSTATYLLLCQKLGVVPRTNSVSSSNSVVFSSDISSVQAIQINQLSGDNTPLSPNQLYIKQETNNANAHVIDHGSQYDNLNTVVFHHRCTPTRARNSEGSGDDFTNLDAQCLAICNSGNVNGHVTSVVLDTMKTRHENTDDRNYLRDVFNSSQGKLQILPSTTHSADSRSIYTRTVVRPTVNITAPPYIVVNPRAILQFNQIRHVSSPKKGHLIHQMTTFDHNRTGQQHRATMGQLSSLFNVPNIHPSVSGIYAHSSPLRSHVINIQSSAIGPQLNKFCDLTIQSYLFNKTTMDRASHISANTKAVPISNTPVFDLRHMSPPFQPKSVFDDRYYVPQYNNIAYDNSCNGNNNNIVVLTTPSHNNQVIVAPSISAANERPLSSPLETTPPLIPQYNFVHVPSLCPVTINMVNFS